MGCDNNNRKVIQLFYILWCQISIANMSWLIRRAHGIKCAHKLGAQFLHVLSYLQENLSWFPMKSKRLKDKKRLWFCQCMFDSVIHTVRPQIRPKICVRTFNHSHGDARIYRALDAPVSYSSSASSSLHWDTVTEGDLYVGWILDIYGASNWKLYVIVGRSYIYIL